MPLAIVFIKEYWKQLVSVLLILSSLVFMSISLYNWGYSSCKKDWDIAIAERNRVQEAQTAEITKLSVEIAAAKESLNKKSDENLTEILLSVQNKPLYKIVNGKCALTPDFEKTYIDIVTYDKEGK